MVSRYCWLFELAVRCLVLCGIAAKVAVGAIAAAARCVRTREMRAGDAFVRVSMRDYLYYL